VGVPPRQGGRLSPAAGISVVVPCLLRTPDDARLLHDTLASVDAQTVAPLEVLVVDDGGPLEAAPVVAAHARARALRQANTGPALARNAAARESRGEHLVFLDGDDLLHPHALAAGLAAFAERPDAMMVVGRHDDMHYDGTPTGVESGLPPAGQPLLVTLLNFDWYIIPPSSCMMRRDAFGAVGGWRDPWGADDLDLYLRLACLGPVHCYGGPPVTRYRRYPQSSSRDGARMLHSVRTVYERFWPHVAGDAALEAAYHQGLARLVEIFQRALVENVEVRLAAGDLEGARERARLLEAENPALAREVLDGPLGRALV
jgi:glycosyltransferase involved in cell wall biosynthesis